MLESTLLMKHELKNLLLFSGADLVGIADLEPIPSDVRNDLPCGISIGVSLNPQVISEIQDGPTKQYFAEYERANTLLDELGHIASEFLNNKGFKTRFLPATSANYDQETLTSPLPHKTAATRAGLGWIGKCALLITKNFGSAIRITTVLTDANLPSGNPTENHLCGKCTLCVESCPGRALSGKTGILI